MSLSISLEIGDFFTLENNFPCICGHPASQHVAEWGYLDGAAACMISPDAPHYHLCVYKPDNLLYLEEEYERH